jgi:hypothetical protein
MRHDARAQDHRVVGAFELCARAVAPRAKSHDLAPEGGLHFGQNVSHGPAPNPASSAEYGKAHDRNCRLVGIWVAIERHQCACSKQNGKEAACPIEPVSESIDEGHRPAPLDWISTGRQRRRQWHPTRGN